METPRPPRVTGSYGAEATVWIREYLGDELRPWQRYAIERALEHDETGALVWSTVIVTVSRQSGKSVLARGTCGWRLGAADVFGEPQDVLHIANLRSTARKIWAPAARRLELSIGARIRRANGQEAIELGTDGELGSWYLAAATVDGGVGSSNALAFVDEAWRVGREVVDDAVVPTLAERNSSQLWLVSTAGDGGSHLLVEERAAAIKQMADPDSASILILEWSAPPEAADDDREAWRQASPHWSERRRRFLEQTYARLFATTGDPVEDAKKRLAWRRQYLNQWVDSASSWLAPNTWDAAGRDELPIGEVGGTIAIEHAVAGFPFGAVLAVPLVDDPDAVGVTARTFEKRRDLLAWLDEITRERRGIELRIPPTLRAAIPQSVRAASREVVGQAEQYAGYGTTLAAANEGRILHDRDAELRAHVLSAGTVRTPDRGTVLSSKHSTGPIFLARALVWAVANELRPDRRRKPLVVGARK